MCSDNDLKDITLLLVEGTENQGHHPPVRASSGTDTLKIHLCLYFYILDFLIKNKNLFVIH